MPRQSSTKTGTSSRKSAAKKSPGRSSTKKKSATAVATVSVTKKKTKKSGIDVDLSNPYIPPPEPTKPETVELIAAAETAAAEAKQAAEAAEKTQRDAWQAARGEILETMQTVMDHHTAESKTMQEAFETERDTAIKAHTQAVAEKREAHESVMSEYRAKLDAINKKLGIAAAPAFLGSKSPPSADAPALPKDADIDPALWARITQPVPYEINSVREAVLTAHSNAGDDTPVSADALRYAVAHFLGRSVKKVSGQIPNACNALRKKQKMISNRGCDRGHNKITALGKKQVAEWVEQAEELAQDSSVATGLGEIAQTTATTAAAPPVPVASTNGHTSGKKNPLGPSDRYIVLACHRAGDEVGRTELAKGVMGLKYKTEVQDPEKFRNSLQAGIRRAVESDEIKVTQEGTKSFYSVTAKGKKEGAKLDKEAKKLGV